MTQDRYEHARQNAKAWAEQLIALHAEHGNLDDIDPTEHDQQGDIEDRAREMPLSVQVRSLWYTPGSDDKGEPGEYEILLTTGGPALRVTGTLSGGEPDSARLEIQDWFLPWDEVGFSDIAPARLRDALMWFASLFYYGE